MQYSLIPIILNGFKIHGCALAYKKVEESPKSPILRNAKLHSTFKYTIRVDFKDFFYSIKSKDFVKILKSHSRYSILSEDEISFLTNILFLEHKKYGFCLAIGAPTSPILSNIIMHSLDEEIYTISHKLGRNNVYTRYSDDIIFSTNQKGDCNIFFNELNELLKKNDSPYLEINEQKTIYSSRGKRRRITGLIICPNTKISIGRSNKRYIKKLVHEFKIGILNVNEDITYLKGYLAFILDVEPSFYNSLVMKYGYEVFEKLKDYQT